MSVARKVLIVEDEEILAGNLKSHLERASCDARIAADGASALELVSTFAPEVVVLDYRLPDMTGFDVFDAIGKNALQGPCILITGHPSDAVLNGANERGIEHILFKPFPLAELSKVVHETGAGASQIADRRQHARSEFPMRLYDGTWLYAERRRPPSAAG